MRTLPANVVQDMLRDNPKLTYLAPIKINHSELTEPLYLIDNTKNITSSAIDPNKEHIAFPYKFTMPAESKEQPLATAKIEFTNIDTRIVNIARASTEQPDFIFTVVTSADLNAPLVNPPVEMKMSGITWNNNVIRCTLRFKDIMQKVYPNKSWTPYVAGGLFQR